MSYRSLESVVALGGFKTTMDDYINLGRDTLVPEYTLAVSADAEFHKLPNTITVKPDILVDCPAPHELRENMIKRLMKGNTGGQNLCVIAMMCLGSGDYSVSHVSVCDVTEKQMLKVWSYLERQSVSSSYLLRQWMRSHMDRRTCEGYMAHWGISANHGNIVGNNVIQRRSWSKCVDVTYDMAHKVSGQPTTVLESVYHDMVASTKLKLVLGR